MGMQDKKEAEIPFVSIKNFSEPDQWTHPFNP